MHQALIYYANDGRAIITSPAIIVFTPLTMGYW